MTNRSKSIGTACETAIVKYVRPRGFAAAERLALHGASDEGDVQLCPGVIVEAKGGHAAEDASDALVATWLAQAEAERQHRGADVCVLVLKRKGKGGASAGQWWAILPGWAFCGLAERDIGGGGPGPFAHLPPARLTLADAVDLLRRAGYGDPLDEGP